MKRIILSLIFLFSVTSLFSQEVFKLGIVKGKEVTYKVRERKSYCEGKTISGSWVVQNIHNPDTTIKPVPNWWKITGQVQDITMQVLEIIHNHLSAEELLKLKGSFGTVVVLLRVDSITHQLLQVTCFNFDNNHTATPFFDEPIPPYNGFWLNLDPDRLHEIEKAIVKQVRLPRQLQKGYIRHDIPVVFDNSEVIDLDKIQKERKRAIWTWMRDSDMELPIGWPQWMYF